MSIENKILKYGTKYNTDKVTHHKYHNIYDLFLRNFYEKKGCIVEIGIDEGSSLNMWLDVFPNAFIYGIDLNKNYLDDKYTVIKADQSNPSHLDNIVNIIKTDNKNELFFINDDGSHIPEHQLLTFNKLFPLLCEEGVYIIEDVETSYWTKGTIYGYPTKYGYKNSNSIVEIFKECVDIVNSEFSGDCNTKIEHLDSIDSLTFSRNCIIIVKKKQEKRQYRFSQFI